MYEQLFSLYYNSIYKPKIKLIHILVYFLLSLVGMIFLNLGERKKGELSAYSVFNKGFMKLLGTTTAEQFENEILHRNNFEIDPPIDEGINDIDININPPRDVARKKGKKARRNYEERLQRRAEQQHNQNNIQQQWEDED